MVKLREFYLLTSVRRLENRKKKNVAFLKQNFDFREILKSF